MVVVDYKNEMGEVKIEQRGEKFTLKIYKANCLGAVIYKYYDTKPGDKKRTLYYSLYTFFNDKQHINNIMQRRGKLFFDEKIISVKLNMKYKECETLATACGKSGYKTTLYYK